MDICLAGAFGPTGYIRDLGDTEPDHMAKHDCFALNPGEGVETALPRRSVWWLEIVSAGLYSLRDQSRASGTVPKMVAPGVEGDGPNPRFESKLPYPLRRVPGEGAIGADQGFLAQVLGLMPVAGHATEAPVEARRHVLDQTRERSVEIAGKVTD